MSDCLSCMELEEKICELASWISEASCAVVIKEGDTVIDNSAALKSQVAILAIYQKLYDSKNCGMGSEVYEFVNVPCVTPVTCDAGCHQVPTVRNQRRYRR